MKSKITTTMNQRLMQMPSAQENAKIVAAAKTDPDAKPMTKAQLETMVPLRLANVAKSKP